MQVHPWRARRAITHVGIERIWPLMPDRLHFPVHHVSAAYRRKSYPSFSGTRRGRTCGTTQHSPLECKGKDSSVHRFYCDRFSRHATRAGKSVKLSSQRCEGRSKNQ